MRLATLLLGLFVASIALVEVTCITNQEFFDSIKDHVEDLEEFDIDDPAIDDHDDDTDAIELPGNADDELDVGYLMAKLGAADVLQGLQKAKAPTSSNSLGWWRRRRRRRKPWRNPCTCRRMSCNCCLRHTIKINLLFKKYRFGINACVRVGYLPRDYGFVFTITFNGRRLFHKEISLKRPPAMCYGFPRFSAVKGCIEVYNVNIRAKSLCVRLAAYVNIIVKKFRFRFKIGCFRIPIMDSLESADAMSLLENLQGSVEDTETGEVTDVSLSDLPSLYRQLQVDLAEKYAEPEVEGWIPEEDTMTETDESSEDLGDDQSDALMFEADE